MLIIVIFEYEIMVAFAFSFLNERIFFLIVKKEGEAFKVSKAEKQVVQLPSSFLIRI